MKNFRNETVYFETFPQYFNGLATRNAGKNGVTQYDRFGKAQTFTYDQLISDGMALAEILLKQGIRGEHIAIVGENSYQWLVIFIGITCSENTAVCIDTEQPDEVIRKMIQHADASYMFVFPSLWDVCSPLLEEAAMKKAVCVDFGKQEDRKDSQLIYLSDIIMTGKNLLDKGSSLVSALDTDPMQTALIVYTSGTTSESKPVMLSHVGAVTNICDSLSHVSCGKTVFTSLPFYHTYGLLTCVFTNMLNGSHMFLNGNIKTLFRDLMAARAESICAVPIIMETIHAQIWAKLEQAGKAEEVRKLIDLNLFLRHFGLSFGTKKLREIKEKAFGPMFIVPCGGAHISKQICEELDLFGIRILQGYGITECSPVISSNCNNWIKMGTVGQVYPHYQLKFVEGEIWVKGISLMKGYYKNDELTQECMEDGWYKTGDLGQIDRQGFLSITGRKKNLIVLKNGKKLSPELFEKKIYEIPLVQEAVVYGTSNSEAADDVKLAVSIFPDPERTKGLKNYEILEQLNQAVEEINESLPFYQKIQLVSIRKTKFEKTSSGKIKRTQIGGTASHA